MNFFANKYCQQYTFLAILALSTTLINAFLILLTLLKVSPLDSDDGGTFSLVRYLKKKKRNSMNVSRNY